MIIDEPANPNTKVMNVYGEIFEVGFQKFGQQIKYLPCAITGVQSQEEKLSQSYLGTNSQSNVLLKSCDCL